MDVETRLDFLINNLSKLTTDDAVHHFYPQTYFIDREYFNNFNLINMKNLSKILNTSMTNSTKSDINIQLNIKQMQYIKNIYKDDYEFFNKFNFRINSYTFTQKIPPFMTIFVNMLNMSTMKNNLRMIHSLLSFLSFSSNSFG